jgi:iron complex outermembrane receptor protein
LVPSWKGQIAFRALVTQYTENMVKTGLGTDPNNIYSTLGDGGQGNTGPPHWRMVDSLNYSNGPLNTTVTARLQGAGVLDDRYIQCSFPNCPKGNPGVQVYTINDNHIPGYFYLDASISYDFDVGNSHDLQAYFNVRNLFNRDPGIVPYGPGDYTFFEYVSKTADGYDVLGRQYLLGFRFKM